MCQYSRRKRSIRSLFLEWQYFWWAELARNQTINKTSSSSPRLVRTRSLIYMQQLYCFTPSRWLEHSVNICAQLMLESGREFAYVPMLWTTGKYRSLSVWYFWETLVFNFTELTLRARTAVTKQWCWNLLLWLILHTNTHRRCLKRFHPNTWAHCHYSFTAYGTAAHLETEHQPVVPLTSKPESGWFWMNWNVCRIVLHCGWVSLHLCFFVRPLSSNCICFALLCMCVCDS